MPGTLLVLVADTDSDTDSNSASPFGICHMASPNPPAIAFILFRLAETIFFAAV
jgi:hypothetical protein